MLKGKIANSKNMASLLEYALDLTYVEKNSNSFKTSL